jgi:hypothetical protein
MQQVLLSDAMEGLPNLAWINRRAIDQDEFIWVDSVLDRELWRVMIAESFKTESRPRLVERAADRMPVSQGGIERLSEDARCVIAYGAIHANGNVDTLRKTFSQGRRETRIQNNYADAVAGSRQCRGDRGAINRLGIGLVVDEDESPISHSMSAEVKNLGLVFIQFH